MAVDRKRYVIRFIGHVQGVGFRVTCRQEAMGLDVRGHVCNNADGSVTIDMDAMPADAKELIGRIQDARRAHIDDTQVQECQSEGRSEGFFVRR